MYSTIFSFARKSHSDINKKLKPSKNGLYLLKMDVFYRNFGYVSIAAGCTIPIFLILEDDFREVAILTSISLFSFFTYGGISLLLLYYNHKCSFNRSNIKVQSKTKGKTTINWRDIEKIKFKPFSGSILIQDRTQNKVKIKLALKGSHHFMDLIDSKTKWNTKKMGMRNFSRLNDSFKTY